MRKYRTYEEVLAEMMKRKAFAKEYKALKPKYEAISAVIKARLESGLTQEELAKKLKTDQGNISRLESGRVNPTITFLSKVAAALDRKLEIEFKPVC